MRCKVTKSLANLFIFTRNFDLKDMTGDRRVSFYEV